MVSGTSLLSGGVPTSGAPDGSSHPKTTAVLHAAAVLEAVLTAKDQDLSEAALHSVLKPLAESLECQWLLPHLGPAATDIIRRLRVTI
jgi:hypothetical protein